jgi:hypothetical protein
VVTDTSWQGPFAPEPSYPAAQATFALTGNTFITPLDVAVHPKPWGTQCCPKVKMPIAKIAASNSNVLFIAVQF